MFRITTNRRWIAPVAGVIALGGLLGLASPTQAADRNDHRPSPTPQPIERHDDRHSDDRRDRDFRGGRGGLSVGIDLGGHDYNTPGPAGHYVDLPVTTLISDAHYERVWVPDVTELRRDRHRRTYAVCVTPGHYVDTLVPTQYETHYIHEWVVDAPVCPPPAPRFGIGIRF